MKHGKLGRNAKDVFEHLIYTARKQRTNSVWANNSYISKGIGLGVKSIEQAKAFLKQHGLIKYVRRRDKQSKVTRCYIVVKTMRNPTTKSDSVISNAVKGDSSGFDQQILERERKSLKGERSSRSSAALMQEPHNGNQQGMHCRIQLVFQELHGAHFTNYGKEGSAIKKLITHVKRAHPNLDPEATILWMAGFLVDLKNTRRERFWKDVTVSPSELLSRWDRIYEIAKRKRETETEWESLDVGVFK